MRVAVVSEEQVRTQTEMNASETGDEFRPWYLRDVYALLNYDSNKIKPGLIKVKFVNIKSIFRKLRMQQK